MRLLRNQCRDFLTALLACSVMLAVSTPACGQLHSEAFLVSSYGAKGDGRIPDTRAIQAAIDDCHRHGGGTVTFHAGTFLTGSLHLKSGVCLHLDHGTTLLASQQAADFDPYETLAFKNAADQETSYFHHALIWAEDAERIAITGTGTIHGNREKRGGPKPIALKRCKYVTISGVTITNAPNYSVSLLGTDYVTIAGVTILNGYSDGIDPDCCHHVRISNCHIESWDDAIVAKTSFSLGQRRSTEDLVVSNCSLASNCNAFKLGTESGGDFRNISVSNCAIFSRSGSRPPISGISLLSVDGARIDGVAISNITISDARCPLFLRLGNRGRDLTKPEPGVLKNVTITNLVAGGAQWPCTITGIPEHPVEGLVLTSVRITIQGGGGRELTRLVVPEHIAKYPSADMFGTLPASCLYCRHARHLQLARLGFESQAADSRDAVLCDDVSDLEIESLEAPVPASEASFLHCHQVHRALIRGCMPRKGNGVFLKVSGAQSESITLMANDFVGVGKAFELDPSVPKQPVTEIGNRK